MSGAPKFALVAGCLAAVVLATGCGAQPGSTHRASLQDCAGYGVRAIEQHLTVTRVPAACRGLTRAQIDQAVTRAVDIVAGGRRKVAWRRAAVAAGARLARLVTTPQPAISPAPGGIRPVAARQPPTGRGIAVAALLSWLLTAGIGSYLLVGWLMRGRIGLPRGRPGGIPSAVIVGHFGLAATGLVGWVAYLVTDRVFLAWTAVGLLLAVAGLGMATLLTGLDAPARAAVTAVVTAGASADGSGVIPAGDRSAGIVPSAGRPPVLLIAGHGALAMATLLLAVAAATAPGR
jgi:hypothetical protein